MKVSTENGKLKIEQLTDTLIIMSDTERVELREVNGVFELKHREKSFTLNEGGVQPKLFNLEEKGFELDAE